MRVLLDAHMLGQREGGNETYVAGLLDGFAELGPTAAQITALYSPGYTPRPGPHAAAQLADRSDVRRLLFALPVAARRSAADVVHVTYNAPFQLTGATVVTVHDVIYRRYPAYFSPRVRLLLNTLLPLSMRRADLVITDSEASRHEIAHYYPAVAEKVRVVPIAAGPVASTPPDVAAAESLTGGRPFVLAVGTLQPRKNIARLVEAYIRLRQAGVTDARLVVVGQAAWQSSPIQRMAAESPFAGDIIFPGYLDDATVAALYRRCTAFVYPSLYEGFGLPVLEAMACGAPVITSNLSSLPEVAGDAALLVDPHSVEAIGTALAQLIERPELRAELRRRGAQRAAQFSWERTARGVLEVYHEAVERHRARRR